MSGVALAPSLGDHLRALIAATGAISIASYMEAALFDPRWGYYATRDPLGAGGDFVTAPEMSQIFGELVGLWCVDLWRRLGAPDPVILAELGPGRGTLMRDALRAARVVPEFARAARLHLIERSPVLRAAQARALPAASAQWHDDASTLPPGPLLLIANEFLDALPIRQYLRGPLTPSLSPEGRGGLRDLGGWHERRVGLAEGGLAFVLDPAPAAMGNLPPGLADAAPGSICETRPAASALARLVATRLAAEGGAALFIDYGHGDSACGDTLQAVRRHRAHPVLAEPGAADLTAHVDFAAFAAAASEAGARVWGPVDQGAFLGALGIAARTEALMANATPEAAALLGSATLRLVDPAHMGRLFKVVALTHPAAPAPAGFA